MTRETPIEVEGPSCGLPSDDIVYIPDHTRTPYQGSWAICASEPLIGKRASLAGADSIGDLPSRHLGSPPERFCEEMGGQRAQPPTLNKIIKKSTGKKQGVCLHCDKSGEDSQWRCGNTCCTSCWCKARRAGQPIKSRQPRRRHVAALASVGPAAVPVETTPDVGAAGVARPTAAQADMVQRSMQGLGWGSGGEDQAAGNPTDQASAHSWPHTWSQAPAVLHGMHGLAAAALRGGLMDCFARVRAATSEMQAGTGEPQTRQDAAGRQQQQQAAGLQLSTGGLQAEAGEVGHSVAQAPVTAEGSGSRLQEGSSGPEHTAAQVSAAAHQTGAVQQPRQQRKSRKVVLWREPKTKAKRAKKHGTCLVCEKVGEDSQWRRGGTLCTACYCLTWKRKGSLVAGSRKRQAPDSDDVDYSGSKAGEAGPQEEQQHEERPWRRKRVRSAHGTKAAVLQQTPEEAGRRPSLDNASSTDEGSGQRVVKQRLAAAIKAFLHLDSNGPECQEHHAPPDGGQEALGSNFAERNRVRPGEEDGMDIAGGGAAEPSSSNGDTSGMPSGDAGHRVWVDVDRAQAALRGLDEDDKTSVGILCSLMYHS